MQSEKKGAACTFSFQSAPYEDSVSFGVESKSLMRNFLNFHFEEWLGSIMLLVMSLIAFINVIIRYCTNFSFSASEELTINFFVWVVLLGTARSFREGTHFGMNIFYDFMPRPVQVVFHAVGIVCCVAFFAMLTYLGGVEVYDEFSLNVSSESLDIPVWLYTMATPLFSALTIVRILQREYAERAVNFAMKE